MINVKIVQQLLVSVVQGDILQIEPQPFLFVAADQKVPQIVGVENCDQGEGERKRNAESFKCLRDNLICFD